MKVLILIVMALLITLGEIQATDKKKYNQLKDWVENILPKMTEVKTYTREIKTGEVDITTERLHSFKLMGCVLKYESYLHITSMERHGKKAEHNWRVSVSLKDFYSKKIIKNNRRLQSLHEVEYPDDYTLEVFTKGHSVSWLDNETDREERFPTFEIIAQTEPEIKNIEEGFTRLHKECCMIFCENF